MTRAELAAAIERVVDAERCFHKVMSCDQQGSGAVMVARREVRDARSDLGELLAVLDHELAFEPELAIKA